MNDHGARLGSNRKERRTAQLRGRLAGGALAVMLLAGSLLAQDGYPPQNGQPTGDPPSRVARISVAQGNVSLEPAGVDTFAQAELNYPLTAGDRVYADNTSLAELQTSGLAVRLGNGADLTLSSLTDAIAQFGLAQGSIRLRTRDLSTQDGQQGTVEVDTPNGTVLVLAPGDIRVDSYPQDDTTVITVTSGQVEISAGNFDQTLGPNQSLRLTGNNPVYAEALRLLPPDALDNFDNALERQRQQDIALSEQYVDPGMIGAGDLGQYGDWNPDPDYGAVWFPRAVPAGWQPYSNGHWAWVAPWGWTWIEAEPWGFAPFHYGRWAQFGGRWGWVAGPPPSAFRQAGFGARPPRPVYSPALVAFVGGPGFSISLGFGGGSGAGVTAWFPLGPHEAYQPWYHASPAYVNRVNVTNIYSRNVTEIHNTYVNRTVNVYNTTTVTNTTYVNRQVATVAVTQHDFASGRPVAQSQRPRLDANTQRQLAAAPILPHPLVTPAPAIAAPQAPARAVPPSQARPVVETRAGFVRAGTGQPAPAPAQNQPARPSVNPQAPLRYPSQQQLNPAPTTPVNPRAGGEAPVVSSQPVQAQPAQPQPAQPGNRGGFPQQREHPVIAPVPVPATPAAPAQAPAQGRFSQPAPTQTPQPNQPRSPIVPAVPARAPAPAPAAAVVEKPAPRPADQPRPLVNRAEPQPVQPPFQQQRQAIERNDPGRPLGPQQVENIRQGRPAGPPAQAEPVAHPAPPAGRPAPPAAVPAKKPDAPR